MRRFFCLSVIFCVFHFFYFSGGLFAAAAPETLELLKQKLDRWDVETVWPDVLDALQQFPQDAGLMETAAQIAYNRGDYPEALRLMKKAIEVGEEEETRQGFALFIEETINVLATYKRYESPHFVIMLDEQQDGVLIDYLIEALEKTYEAVAERYGFQPDHKIRVELFPDTVAFYRGSALSVRDIEVTGAVGLTKFNKLQFLSPMALVHGYRWLDAISHEYMHYVIVKKTANNAPIWFHEGLSKYEETLWRKGPDYLSALNRTLLARALADNMLIGFEKMEPSLIHLETPEEVQLAYAQAASAIEFIIQTAGHQGLRAIMDAMAQGQSKGTGVAIKTVLAMEFSEFEQKWRSFLAAKGLEPVDGVVAQRYKVKEGDADAPQMDLKEIKSLVARNRTHLGDKLKERGRTRAAALEYQRALADTSDSVPVMNRLSAVLIELGREDDALEVLNRSLSLDPDHPAPYTQLGRIHLKRKEFKQAQTAFEESIQINPFNPEIHIGLAKVYDALGDRKSAEKEQNIIHRLRR